MQEKYWLVKKAGLDLNCSDIVSITARRWNSFEEWYMKCLDALKTVMGTWDQTEPVGFSAFRAARFSTALLLIWSARVIAMDEPCESMSKD